MKKTLLALAFIASTSTFANAKGGKVGANFQYSSKLSSIGVWWHITDLVAINPFVGYDSSTDKKTQATLAGNTTLACTAASTNCTSNATTGTWTVGMDIPIYIAKFNALDLFVAPGVAYGNSGTTTKYENPVNGQTFTADAGSTATWTFALTAGLQIALLEQLHVFGKAGFEYSIKSYPSNPVAATNTDYLDKTTNFATARAAIGAIFYFN